MNPNLTYEYKGDETNFPVLKDKGLYGYVFLPDIDTDLGYFIDKNNSHIYYHRFLSFSTSFCFSLSFFSPS